MGMNETMPKKEIIISTYIPQFMRYVISSVALIVVCIAGWEFFKAALDFSVFSLFFCLLTGTGIFMGAKLMHAILLSFNEEWKIKRKIIEITATRGENVQKREILSSNINGYNILARSSESGPDTYVLELHDYNGNKYISPHFSERNDAQYAIDLFFAKA